jgi:hypothetical protein
LFLSLSLSTSLVFGNEMKKVIGDGVGFAEKPRPQKSFPLVLTHGMRLREK